MVNELRSHRAVLGIARENLAVTVEEFQRINAAIEEIISTQQDLAKRAIETGMSLIGIHP